MERLKTRWTRRHFLQGAGLASVMGVVPRGPLAAAVEPWRGRADRPPALRGIYEELNLRPFINAAGTYTSLSACIMPREVVAAMDEASRQHVSIPELQTAAGDRIASLVGAGAEAALITAGCADALTHATAACVCGTDEEKIRRVPDTAGMKNEVIFQKSHRFSFDHAIRNVGVKIVEIETEEELWSAINDRTAMLFFLDRADNEGRIKREEFARIAHQAGIPSLIDAAASLPPAENLSAFSEMGYDLVAFSGGKGLRGPQCSGLLLGRKDLIEAAFLNGSPHADSVGRPAKVGKEEVVGLMTAVELYVKKDHDAEWVDWERQVSFIASAVSGIRGVHAEQFVPESVARVPHLAITWDPDAVRTTREGFANALREGEPRIEVRPSPPDEPRLEVAVWMLQPGEYQIVARRCAEVVEGVAARASR